MGTEKANAVSKHEIASKIPAEAHPLSEEPTEIASNINYHAQFSPHFSPLKFEPEQAFYATAESVQDRLIKVPIRNTHTIVSLVARLVSSHLEAVASALYTCLLVST